MLQEGIGEERAERASALTRGLRQDREREFLARFTSLSYQHRMHPEISEFPRELIYEGAVLAVLVVFLFLRDWRATLIAAVALPLSVIP